MRDFAGRIAVIIGGGTGMGRAAKFAKGFTEAPIGDLRLNAPHVKCPVVMPGHIGTSILSNSRKVQNGYFSDKLTDNDVASMRRRMSAGGVEAADISDDEIRAAAREWARAFLEDAPTTAAAAARTIQGFGTGAGAFSSATTPTCSTPGYARCRSEPMTWSSTPASPPRSAGGSASRHPTIN
jgi:hypothetical protein